MSCPVQPAVYPVRCARRLSSGTDLGWPRPLVDGPVLLGARGAAGPHRPGAAHDGAGVRVRAAPPGASHLRHQGPPSHRRPRPHHPRRRRRSL
eukprot:3269355-Rhodomonas_salina.2